MAEEHPLKPFYSVLVLAFACSTLVALAAVGLQPYQQANRSLDQKKNILVAAGLFQDELPISEQFKTIEPRLVELATGRFVDPPDIDPETYDQRSAALSDDTGRALARENDPAGIRRLEDYSLVYLVRQDGAISQVVLPVRGKGLWSTMYAYVAIEADLNTINGISFYEHGETPGLGGEVENSRWQKLWQGKQLFDSDGALAFTVRKPSPGSDPATQHHQVDGLSGATLTSDGVDRLMQFWFGEHGFKPFFEQVREQGGFNG
ncbi:Na(+)-translocating NADH-quinone reductase subunit C [Desulfofustis limnaeus]|jgi:Na+-transporting NADH:ubiquinone oxidoreductase subunit C|uniref:Na(+)-translocating NADH-quinone reductase subunit C n=1 Tax=Desulfofustis limnaeus TaxID=2740163 RepID=A0ABM7WBX6_9BACT|nr:Na(+)-translocating NADH-quinone reductase subunit C [Desulfofustis limnaeus]MDX9895222.1 Na(+)-translocating NADH-quinone reductase subunit C [Desulfofustis sp.]BDD88511.1 Na(+)-translocating NADH-quinone reductase subunit C [Desulfofustis limnaeus]